MVHYVITYTVIHFEYFELFDSKQASTTQKKKNSHYFNLNVIYSNAQAHTASEIAITQVNYSYLLYAISNEENNIFSYLKEILKKISIIIEVKFMSWN